MADQIHVRETSAGDLPQLEALYRGAFPEEDLLPLVRDLLAEGQGVLSLAATLDGALAGHVIFTTCGIEGTTESVAMLAPLAVASSRQRQGIGSALVRAGFERLKAEGVAQVYVLGDPDYYGRFGFEPESALLPPYALPPEYRDAWQSTYLLGGTAPLCGKLMVPTPWQQDALWRP